MMSSTKQVSKTSLWAGRTISALVVLFSDLSTGGFTKVMKVAAVMEASKRIGFPEGLIVAIGTLLLACTAMYAIPQTSILGAILLTGYSGRSRHDQSSRWKPVLQRNFVSYLFPESLSGEWLLLARTPASARSFHCAIRTIFRKQSRPPQKCGDVVARN